MWKTPVAPRHLTTSSSSRVKTMLCIPARASLLVTRYCAGQWVRGRSMSLPSPRMASFWLVRARMASCGFLALTPQSSMEQWRATLVAYCASAGAQTDVILWQEGRTTWWLCGHFRIAEWSHGGTVTSRGWVWWHLTTAPPVWRTVTHPLSSAEVTRTSMSRFTLVRAEIELTVLILGFLRETQRTVGLLVWPTGLAQWARIHNCVCGTLQRTFFSLTSLCPALGLTLMLWVPQALQPLDKLLILL